MPNTLAHIGIQLPLGKAINRKWDPRWIALGLLIPDLPWILQRIIDGLLPQISPISLRAYVVAMTTPLFCLFLCASIALLFRGAKSIFTILAVQSILHLLLDAAQEKGGVGIPFIAPFSWESYSFPLFSMHGWVSTLLTFSGIIFLILTLTGKLHFSKLDSFNFKKSIRISASALMFLIYIIAPFALSKQVIENNVHDLKTLSGDISRIGKSVHFDRAQFIPGKPATLQDQRVATPVPIIGINLHQPATISTTAVFVDERTLQTESYIIHPSGLRFSYTLFGLLGVMILWIYPLLKKKENQPHDRTAG